MNSEAIPFAPVQLAAIGAALIATLCAVLVSLWPRTDDESKAFPMKRRKADEVPNH